MQLSYWAKQMEHRLLFLGVIAVILVGCSTTPENCDPSNQNANILNKAGCVYGGHYQQRVDEKKTILLDEQKTNQLFQATYDALQQESAQVSSDIDSQAAAVQRMQSSISNLLSQLRASGAGNQQLEEQIDGVETQLELLQETIDDAKAQGQAVPVLQQRQQFAELQVQVQDLQAALGLR